MAAVGAWPVPWGPLVAWERGRSPGPRMGAVGAWPVSWARMAAVGAWPKSWAPHGRRGGVAGPQGAAWLPWGRGRSPGLRMDAVGAWPIPLSLHGRRGGVAGPLVLHGRRGGVIGPLGPAWLLWGRGWSPGSCMAAVVV